LRSYLRCEIVYNTDIVSIEVVFKVVFIKVVFITGKVVFIKVVFISGKVVFTSGLH
jgi:hypothetical protein